MPVPMNLEGHEKREITLKQAIVAEALNIIYNQLTDFYIFIFLNFDSHRIKTHRVKLSMRQFFQITRVRRSSRNV